MICWRCTSYITGKSFLGIQQLLKEIHWRVLETLITHESFNKKGTSTIAVFNNVKSFWKLKEKAKTASILVFQICLDYDLDLSYRPWKVKMMNVVKEIEFIDEFRYLSLFCEETSSSMHLGIFIWLANWWSRSRSVNKRINIERTREHWLWRAQAKWIEGRHW